MASAKVKKVFGILSKILTWLLIIATVLMMVFTILSTTVFDDNEGLFGLKFYVVLSDSMSLSENNKDDDVHFNAGDVILVTEADDPYALRPGDIIAFISQNEGSVGETITHKIRSVNYTTKGELIGYTTYGTNTGTNDKAIVEPEFIIGTYTGRIPALGHFLQFLKTTPGYLTCILAPFLLLIVWQAIGTIGLFRQYKGEQRAEIEAERAQIAQEREESAAMLLELQALREQLAKQNGTATEQTATTEGATATEAAATEEQSANTNFNKEKDND